MYLQKLGPIEFAARIVIDLGTFPMVALFSCLVHDQRLSL